MIPISFLRRLPCLRRWSNRALDDVSFICFSLTSTSIMAAILWMLGAPRIFPILYLIAGNLGVVCVCLNRNESQTETLPLFVTNRYRRKTFKGRKPPAIQVLSTINEESSTSSINDVNSELNPLIESGDISECIDNVTNDSNSLITCVELNRDEHPNLCHETYVSRPGTGPSRSLKSNGNTPENPHIGRMSPFGMVFNRSIRSPPSTQFYVPPTETSTLDAKPQSSSNQIETLEDYSTPHTADEEEEYANPSGSQEPIYEDIESLRAQMRKTSLDDSTSSASKSSAKELVDANENDASQLCNGSKSGVTPVNQSFPANGECAKVKSKSRLGDFTTSEVIYANLPFQPKPECAAKSTVTVPIGQLKLEPADYKLERTVYINYESHDQFLQLNPERSDVNLLPAKNKVSEEHVFNNDAESSSLQFKQMSSKFINELGVVKSQNTSALNENQLNTGMNQAKSNIVLDEPLYMNIPFSREQELQQNIEHAQCSSSSQLPNYSSDARQYVESENIYMNLPSYSHTMVSKVTNNEAVAKKSSPSYTHGAISEEGNKHLVSKEQGQFSQNTDTPHRELNYKKNWEEKSKFVLGNTQAIYVNQSELNTERTPIQHALHRGQSSDTEIESALPGSANSAADAICEKWKDTNKARSEYMHVIGVGITSKNKRNRRPDKVIHFNGTWPGISSTDALWQTVNTCPDTTKSKSSSVDNASLEVESVAENSSGAKSKIRQFNDPDTNYINKKSPSKFRLSFSRNKKQVEMHDPKSFTNYDNPIYGICGTYTPFNSLIKAKSIAERCAKRAKSDKNARNNDNLNVSPIQNASKTNTSPQSQKQDEPVNETFYANPIYENVLDGRHYEKSEKEKNKLASTNQSNLITSKADEKDFSFKKYIDGYRSKSDRYVPESAKFQNNFDINIKTSPDQSKLKCSHISNKKSPLTRRHSHSCVPKREIEDELSTAVGKAQSADYKSNSLNRTRSNAENRGLVSQTRDSTFTLKGILSPVRRYKVTSPRRSPKRVSFSMPLEAVESSASRSPPVESHHISREAASISSSLLTSSGKPYASSPKETLSTTDSVTSSMERLQIIDPLPASDSQAGIPVSFNSEGRINQNLPQSQTLREKLSSELLLLNDVPSSTIQHVDARGAIPFLALKSNVRMKSPSELRMEENLRREAVASNHFPSINLRPTLNNVPPSKLKRRLFNDTGTYPIYSQTYPISNLSNPMDKYSKYLSDLHLESKHLRTNLEVSKERSIHSPSGNPKFEASSEPFPKSTLLSSQVGFPTVTSSKSLSDRQFQIQGTLSPLQKDSSQFSVTQPNIPHALREHASHTAHLNNPLTTPNVQTQVILPHSMYSNHTEHTYENIEALRAQSQFLQNNLSRSIYDVPPQEIRRIQDVNYQIPPTYSKYELDTRKANSSEASGILTLEEFAKSYYDTPKELKRVDVKGSNTFQQNALNIGSQTPLQLPNISQTEHRGSHSDTQVKESKGIRYSIESFHRKPSPKILPPLNDTRSISSFQSSISQCSPNLDLTAQEASSPLTRLLNESNNAACNVVSERTTLSLSHGSSNIYSTQIPDVQSASMSRNPQRTRRSLDSSIPSEPKPLRPFRSLTALSRRRLHMSPEVPGMSNTTAIFGYSSCETPNSGHFSR